MKINWTEVIGAVVVLGLMGFPYYNPVTAGAAPHNAPTPGHFTEWPECTVRPDPSGGVMVTLEGTLAPNARAAEFILDPAPTIDYVPPTTYFSVNGVAQEDTVVPPSKTVTVVSITMMRLSTFTESSIKTRWADTSWDKEPYLFARIYPDGFYADCIVSTN